MQVVVVLNKSFIFNWFSDTFIWYGTCCEHDFQGISIKKASNTPGFKSEGWVGWGSWPHPQAPVIGSVLVDLAIFKLENVNFIKEIYFFIEWNKYINLKNISAIIVEMGLSRNSFKKP